VLVSLIGVQMWPHLFMKAFTAKNNDIIRKTTILFPTFWLFLIPVFLIGFAGVLFPEKPPTSDFVLPFMIMQTDLPPLIVGLFCAGALSASMSTGDALLHGSASVVEEDAVRLFVKLDDKQAQTLMRFLIVIVGVASYLLALGDHSSLVDLLLASYGIICQLAPTVLAAIYWKRATTIGILAGLTSGVFVTTILFVSNQLTPFGLHEGILGLLTHIPVLIIVSLLTEPQREEHVEGFMGNKL
jgi:SSS family solute:Na+ symporter